MNHRSIPALFTLILACCCTISAARTDDTVTSKPNLVFILAGDLGYGELGCYGQTVIQTPRLNLMAK